MKVVASSSLSLIDPIDLVEFCLLILAGLDLGFSSLLIAVGTYPMS